MKTTIYEVANRAGVSTATVSHVCNNTRYVSEEVREKVINAINELHYKPNIVARNLRGGASKAIGLVVPDCTNAFFAETARAIDRVCFALGYNIILCNTDNSRRRQSYYTDMLISKRVDGIIFISTDDADSDVHKCRSYSIPVVIIDRDIHYDYADNIIVNNELGGYQAASYLIRAGFTTIACITGPSGISSSMERTKGFKRALAEHNIAITNDHIYEGNFHYTGGKNAFFYFQSKLQTPYAVFACNDMMAIGFIHSALNNNINIPHDISIIGFDNMELSALMSPLLTTIAQPIEEIAELATKQLLEKIKNRTASVKRTVLEPCLIIRETCIKNQQPRCERRGMLFS